MTTTENTIMNQHLSAYRIVTRLVVTEFDCDATVITDTVRVAPTETWRKGDPVLPGALNLHRQNGWLKASSVNEYATTPEESVAALLSVFPDFTAFRRLPPGAEIELAVTLYGLKERPYFSLSSKYVGELAAIGADIDIDIYDLTGSIGEDA